MQDFFSDLNAEQRAAVEAPDGPLLIVAGAGTGKTTVITRRISWLITTGRCKPDEILAVTFTEKAAAEMEERVDRLLPYGYVNLWIMTFHAFCERILKRHGLDIGIPNDFKLLDQTAAWLLVRKNLDRFNLDYYRPLGNPSKFIHALIKHFSRAKDEDISPQTYREYAQALTLDTDKNPGSETDGLKKITEIADAYHVYEQILLEHNALDFGSLITHTLRLFRERPAILERYRKQFKYILVDEFQDTNLAQYELVKILAAPRNNITVVGDDDQSVFKFRGASYANILAFKKDFSESKEILLTKNYRSPQNILDTAYACIQLNNPNRLECQLAGYGSGGTGLSKKLYAHTQDAGIIEHFYCTTLNEEVERVVQTILQIRAKDISAQWSDFAILIRANSAAGVFIARFGELEIPYQFLSMRGLYAKPVIIDILSYLRLLDNYHEGAALYRVLTWPMQEAISGYTIVELTHYAHQKAVSLWEVCRLVDTIPAIEESQRVKIKEIAARIATHTDLARTKRPPELVLHILRDTGYLAYLKDVDTLEKRESLHYLNQLYKKIHAFQLEYPEARLRDFLTLVAYEQEAGDEGRLSIDIDTGPDAVKILTVHTAKGLEFPYVFIVNMVDRRFPTMERDDAIELPETLKKEITPEGDIHLQEERRLFYVALTRAKKAIFLTSALDYGGSRAKKPSQFLGEIGMITTQAATGVSQQKKKKEDTLSHATTSVSKTSDVPDLPRPSVYSFTQLMAFRNCPLQYKFSFILKIPVFGKPQLSFGKTMHAALQKFFERIIEQADRTQGGLFGSPEILYTKKSPSLPDVEELLALYDQLWIDDWYYSTRQKEEYRQKGREILRRLYEELRLNPPRPKALERDFTMKIGEGSDVVTLKGRIDRVDQKEDGTVSIVDYKTGSPKSEEKLSTEDKEQLLLYQIAEEEVFGEKPTRLTYKYLENGKEISFLGTSEEKSKFKRKIYDTVKKIQTSDFSPTPGWQCRFCDFKDICEYRQL